MNSKQKLIEFMKQKAQILYENNYDPDKEYFTEQDRRAILDWDNRECDVIWNLLSEKINEHEVEGHSIKSCIFCIKYDIGVVPWKIQACNFCEYGKHHYICNKLNSTYQEIMKKEYYLTEINEGRPFSEILSNKVYIEIINKLENDQKENPSKDIFEEDSEGLSRSELKDILESIKHRMHRTTFNCIQEEYRSKEQFESVYLCIWEALNYLDKK